jgi:hypothetical protein
MENDDFYTVPETSVKLGHLVEKDKIITSENFDRIIIFTITEIK